MKTTMLELISKSISHGEIEEAVRFCQAKFCSDSYDLAARIVNSIKYLATYSVDIYSIKELYISDVDLQRDVFAVFHGFDFRAAFATKEDAVSYIEEKDITGLYSKLE